MKLEFFFLTLLVSTLAFGQTSLYGGHDGGGGQGVVCYGPHNQILSVELLDLYEGRHLEDLTYNELPGNYEEIFETIAVGSDARVKNLLTFGKEKILRGLRFMAKGIRLKPIDDANAIFIPKNCKIEQIVNFQGFSRVFVVTDFWDFLSETNKAALLVHEILWTAERERGSLYSSRARRAVSRIFANNYRILPLELIQKSDDIQCLATNEEQLITASFIIPKNSCKLIFTEINSGDIYGIHEAEFNAFDCNVWKNYFLKITGPHNPYPEDDSVRTRNTFLNVTDVGENISSHEINLKMKFVNSKMTFSLDTKNWEFPGFDSKNHELNCFTYIRNPDN